MSEKLRALLGDEEYYRQETLAIRKRNESEEEARQQKFYDAYFFGHRANQPHPRMAATGSEDRCELCGYRESYLHDVYKGR